MIALIGKNNNKGLGTLTKAYLKHLPITHPIFIEDSRTVKDIEGIYTREPEKVIEQLNGLKVLIVLEMPLEAVFHICKRKGIKTILKVNYEFLPESLQYRPDVFLCSSSLNYDSVKYDNKILLADPIDTDLLKVRKRVTCKTFVHNAGTLGIGGANGTQELIDSLQYAKKPFNLILRSQEALAVSDDRVDLRIGDFEYSSLFDEGDVFVMPQKFRATSLPIQEAMCSGMPVLSSDIKPFNEFVNYTFPVDMWRHEFVNRQVNYAILEPEKIAKELDRLYGQDIEKESLKAIEFGQSVSWHNLKDKYIELCNN